ncbi:tetratricopeptide repeat protein [Acaryochloris sp. 'Moss Beach']|uniref:tetratricopeptide repeat protein n=1 Tax=Acaryochloris sp. 'Moss Beach' TaxID=2740837 RepID=UPI001F1D7673|nr:tetratricopeptide repeat protein [Acaryochloris sp. 'Moss Beach']UJB68508.1 tetratricopeptide repeat protein [Acaryochloris sp. 'Moss Beach']
MTFQDQLQQHFTYQDHIERHEELQQLSSRLKVLQEDPHLDIPRFLKGADFGSYQQAQEILQQALQQAEKIDDPDSKASALRKKAAVLLSIAQSYEQLKDFQRAQEILQQALLQAEKIDDPGYKASALGSIAQAYGQLNDFQRAQEILQQALEQAEKNRPFWVPSFCIG